MTNMITEVKGNKLILTIDISPEIKAKAPFSASGKNRVVSTTSGFFAVPNTDLKVGLNVICK